jgi:hypothetical protein
MLLLTGVTGLVADTNVLGTYHTVYSGGGEESGSGLSEIIRSVPDKQEDHEGESMHYVYHYYGRGVRHEWPSATGITTETLEARTQSRLYAGRTAELGLSSLIEVSGDVLDYGKPWSTPWYWTPNTAVGAERQSFLRKQANAAGKVDVVMADGAELDVETKIEASEHYSADVHKAQSRPVLEAVTFQGDGYHSILNDTNGNPYPTPHWETNRVTHVVSNYPLLYVSGSRMEARVRFALEPSEVNSAIIAFGRTTNGFSFIGTNTNVMAGATSVEVTVRADEDLPAERVDFFKPLTISWAYAWTNNDLEFWPVGTSTNWVYVTWHAPESELILYHTVVHLACSKPGGNSADSVFSNTWSNFAAGGGPANVRTWDGQTLLHYYKAGLTFSEAALSGHALIRTNHNGQCGAWRDLLWWALQANGFNWLQGAKVFLPSDAQFMVVREWTFGATNTPDPDFAWQIELALNSEGGPEMVPESAITGPVQPDDGIAGQNTPKPAQKIFADHLVLKNTWDNKNKYYDPSYGKVYTNGADFEAQALAGYARRKAGDTNTATMKLEIRATNPAMGTAIISP